MIARTATWAVDLRQCTEADIPDYITVAQAAKSLPPGRGGRPTHTATIVRWIVDGTLSPTGERVHLRAVRMGGRWLTTRDWLCGYAQQLTPGVHAAPAVRTTATPSLSADRVARELDAIGIL